MSKCSEFLRKINHKFCSAVVVAAGSSSRMGEDKLLMKIKGIPAIVYTLRALDESEEVDEIVISTSGDKLESLAELCREYEISKVTKVIKGGASRTESALAGVSETDRRAKTICIHDGARPFVHPETVNAVIRAAVCDKAAAPAVPVKDTVRIVENGEVTQTPARENVLAMQTPQAFDADLIKAALTKAVADGISYTDDCAAAEAMGVRICIIRGTEDNIKLTTPLDIPLAERIISERGL